MHHLQFLTLLGEEITSIAVAIGAMSSCLPDASSPDDRDRLPDSCDLDDRDGPAGDADADSVLNDDDNCPLMASQDQYDDNDNGIGDACDPVLGQPLQSAVRSADFVGVVRARLLETRSGDGLATVDGADSGLGVREVGTITELVVAGRGGVASDASVQRSSTSRW